MSGDGRRQPAGASAAPAARAEPWGVFSLTHGAAPRADALARPYVRGASVRAYWRDFEPQEGRFDWAPSRSAVTIEGDTLSRAETSLAPGASLRVVPVVVREDGKEALGDVYQVPYEGREAMLLAPLAETEDLSREA